MIAYNYFIKFIPELKNLKSIDGSFSNVITVKENSLADLDEQFNHKMIFFNNQGRDITLYTDRPFERTDVKQRWSFDVEGVVRFFWNSGEFTIDYVKAENFTSQLVAYWILHVVLPIFLTIEEHCYFLHAGAVEIDEKPVLFVAESFGGKSTMTDFFIKQGHVMVSDDKVGVLKKNGEFLAVPSHPHHRPYREMEDLGYFVNNMSNSLKPIHVIYVLHRAASDAHVVITELHGIEKFKSLRYSSEINLSFLKPERFSALGGLAKNVPVYEVRVPWNIGRLEEVYTAIINHCQMNTPDNKLILKKENINEMDNIINFNTFDSKRN